MVLSLMVVRYCRSASSLAAQARRSQKETFLTFDRRDSRGWGEGEIHLLGSLYPYHALDHRPLYELYASAEEDSGRA